MGSDLWMQASLGFSFYVRQIARYEAAYVWPVLC